MKNQSDHFYQRILLEHQRCLICPSPAEVTLFFKQIMGLLYKPYSDKNISTLTDVRSEMKRIQLELATLLQGENNLDITNHEECAQVFMDELPNIYDLLNDDIAAIVNGDPACTGKREVIRSYPGFYASAAYRVANALHRLRVNDLPRIITEHAHSVTGIDIHPGASIGRHFCIDHGTGIVIGETSEIHDHVKIYQGVTLGALSVRKSDADNKRHPTIETGCVLYAGATILGGETVIGANSVIGGNVWLTKSVPANSKIYYQATMADTDGTDKLIVYNNYSK